MVQLFLLLVFLLTSYLSGRWQAKTYNCWKKNIRLHNSLAQKTENIQNIFNLKIRQTSGWESCDSRRHLGEQLSLQQIEGAKLFHDWLAIHFNW